MKAIYRYKGLIITLIITLVFSLDTYGQGAKTPKGPPSWAPAHGYRAQTRYIYFPDQNVYYDNQKGVYISLNGDNWNVSASLPSIFSGVDLNIALKVELDLSTDTPQKYNSDHKTKYKGKGEGGQNQPQKKSNKEKSKKN